MANDASPLRQSDPVEVVETGNTQLQLVKVGVFKDALPFNAHGRESSPAWVFLTCDCLEDDCSNLGGERCPFEAFWPRLVRIDRSAAFG